MNLKKTAALAAAAVLTLCSCDQREAIAAEIKIPILESQSKPEYETATVTVGDIENTETVAGSIGYIYTDYLFTEFESNIIEYCVTRGQRLKAGDPIAIFDSSSIDYEYNSQKLLADDAYSTYLATGSEAARLDYEIKLKQLEYLAYQKDQYTVRAPYDCFIALAQYFEIGTVVPEGTLVAGVAREEDVYVYATEKKDNFRTGMPVKVKFGTNTEFDFHVVMTPGEGGKSNVRNSVNVNGCVVLKPDEGVLEKIIAEVDNAVSAGWATILVQTVSKYGVMTLPEKAVKSFSGSTYCNLLDNGRQVRLEVETGGTYNGKTIILSGLSEGDEVAY